ncbi:myb-like protein X [Agrilus planipennis]|uniref:Myb-like protein X n=1 Tax=Agrilus planipennis TaxID=224129 RepID=A0A1W4XSX3_AGRPL|nr:myb-like protein X [Agrilus planipennis]
MIAAVMVHRFITLFLIGILLPISIARPPKEIKNNQHERRNFDEDRPAATLNCTTTGNNRKSSTNSNVFVKAYDTLYPDIPHSRYMDLIISLDEPQQSSIRKHHNRSERHPKPHKKMTVHFVPVPVMMQEDEYEGIYPFQYPYRHLPPSDYHKHYYMEDDSEEISETLSEVNQMSSTNKTLEITDDETVSSDTMLQCDENKSKPCTEHQNNPIEKDLTSWGVYEEDLEDNSSLSSEEGTSDMETKVNQRIGLMTRDSIKASQLSQNVKISNHVTGNNDTNSSHDCVKHHIIQIININSKDFDDENHDEWYEVEDEAKSLSDDLLVNSSINKTALTPKDIMFLLKKMLVSAEPTVSEERRNESISYVEKEESYNNTKEDLTITIDESKMHTLEEEKVEEDDLKTDIEEENKTTTIQNQKQTESFNQHEEELHAGVSEEKSFSKRSSLETTGTLEQRDPSKRSPQMGMPNLNEEESSPRSYKHYDGDDVRERTRVQKIPRKRKFAGPSNVEGQDKHSIEAKNRSKREISENNPEEEVYNIKQKASIRNKNRKKPLPNDPTTTKIEQDVVIFNDGKNRNKVIKIQTPVRNSDNGNVYNFLQHNSINAETNCNPSSEVLTQNVKRDEEGKPIKEGDNHNPSSEVMVQNFGVDKEDKSTKEEDGYVPPSQVLIQNVGIDEEEKEDKSTKEEGGRSLETSPVLLGSEMPCDEHAGCKSDTEINPKQHKLSRKLPVEEKCRKIFEILNLDPYEFRNGDRSRHFPQIINQIAQIFPYPGIMKNMEETDPSVVSYDGDDSKK